MLFSPQPHGIAGPWDEVLVLSILVGYGIIALLGSRRRKRTRQSESLPDWLQTDLADPSHPDSDQPADWKDSA